MNKTQLKNLPLNAKFHLDENNPNIFKVVSKEPMIYEPIYEDGGNGGWSFPVEKTGEAEKEVFVISLPKGYDFYDGKIVETIDITPTWEQILPNMFMCYENFVTTKKPTPEQIESLKYIKKEFKRMAKIADKWVEHSKTLEVA